MPSVGDHEVGRIAPLLQLLHRVVVHCDGTVDDETIVAHSRDGHDAFERHVGDVAFDAPEAVVDFFDWAVTKDGPVLMGGRHGFPREPAIRLPVP